MSLVTNVIFEPETLVELERLFIDEQTLNVSIGDYRDQTRTFPTHYNT